MSEFSIELSVRDYELDAQGIVNNSVYQNYLEHARHEFLHHHGVDFVAFAEQNILLVVKTIELNFKDSLRARDQFKVIVKARKEGNLRIVFDQTIVRLSDNKTALTGKVTGVCLVKGRPVRPESLPAIDQFLEQIEVEA